MALTFSSVGCKTAADELTAAKTQLTRILYEDLNSIMENVKKAYQSEGANEVYSAYDKVKAKFPEFITSVDDCIVYLKEVVAPAYEQLESKISSSTK